MSFLFLFLLAIAFVVLAAQMNNKLHSLKKELLFKIDRLNERITQLEGGREPKTPSAPIEQPKPVEEEKQKTSIPEVSQALRKVEAPPKRVPPKIPTYNPSATPPSAFDKLISDLGTSFVKFFTTGNTVVKVGVIVLFFGVSFLVKFASEKGLLPIEFRLLGAAIGGIFLTQFGWRLRSKKESYALALQGGGVGILFITVFAAFKIYHLLPAVLAFALLVFLAGFTALMAIAQNSISLASFGIVGGFLAPVLASTGEGNHVVLFSYYAILNAGILAVAWFRAWRILNLLGFVFTFVIGTAWGVLRYQPEHFWTVEPFLILFFLFYVAIPILFARRQEPKLRGYVDGTLVFGNTILSFGLQTQLVQPFDYATAFSALAMSLFYLMLGRVLYARGGANCKLLVEAFAAIGVVFATITIPLAFDGHWTAAVWAAEAAGIYWLSVRQNRPLGRAFSTALVFASGIAFFFHHQRGGFEFPVLNSFYFGCLMIALGSFVASFVGYRNQEKLGKWELRIPPLFFLFGAVWIAVGGFFEIERHLTNWWVKRLGESPYSPAYYLVPKNLSLIYFTLITCLASWLGKKLNWVYLIRFSFCLVLYLLVAILRVDYFGTGHPFTYYGFLAWPLAFLGCYLLLYWNESFPKVSAFSLKWGHAMTLWSLGIVGAWELGWQANQWVGGGYSWKEAAIGIFPLFLVATVIFKRASRLWPFAKHGVTYLVNGLAPIMLSLWFWVFYTNWNSSGDPSPLPYIPVLNPLELVQGLFMILLPLWLFAVHKSDRLTALTLKQIGGILGFTYFFWANGILMRSIHHFAGIPFEFHSLFSSVLVQASLSIYWSLIGIFLMIFASRKKYRWLWVSGVSLMGIVVIKLFMIDLSNSNTVERIVSFLSVGILLLVVGYFSPIPPKKGK